MCDLSTSSLISVCVLSYQHLCDLSYMFSYQCLYDLSAGSVVTASACRFSYHSVCVTCLHVLISVFCVTCLQVLLSMFVGLVGRFSSLINICMIDSVINICVIRMQVLLPPFV